MSCAPATKATRALAAALLCGALSACAETYLERRDRLSFSSGEALAANRVVHMVDPWPRQAGNRDIAFDGERMRAAAERYRTGQVIKPVAATTSSAAYAPPAAGGTTKP